MVDAVEGNLMNLNILKHCRVKFDMFLDSILNCGGFKCIFLSFKTGLGLVSSL